MKSKLIPFLICAFVFLFGNIFIVKGQQPLPVNPSGGNIGDKFYEMRGRANELSRIKDELNKPEERKPEATFPRIKKDFEKLQIVNTEKLQKNSSGKSLNYKVIADASEEINTHALKLKSSLFPNDEIKKQTVKMPDNLTVEGFTKIIIALDNSIYRFTGNPIFQNTKLVKPEDSENAEKELNKIILFSEILELNAVKMK